MKKNKYSKKMVEGDRVRLKSRKSITGIIDGTSTTGFNHYFVKWNNQDEPVREYGYDLEKI